MASPWQRWRGMVMQADRDSERALRVQIKLADYAERGKEKVERSDRQYRILQTHVAVLVALVGTALTIPQAGAWLVYLIPIESSLFGFWFDDNGFNILKCDRYCDVAVGNWLAAAVPGGGITWHDPRAPWEPDAALRLQFSRRRILGFRVPLFLTFAGASLVSLLVALGLILISLPAAAPRGLTAPYRGSLWLAAALALWLLCAALALTHVIPTVRQLAFVDRHRAQFRHQPAESIVPRGDATREPPADRYPAPERAHSGRAPMHVRTGLGPGLAMLALCTLGLAVFVLLRLQMAHRHLDASLRLREGGVVSPVRGSLLGHMALRDDAPPRAA